MRALRFLQALGESAGVSLQLGKLSLGGDAGVGLARPSLFAGRELGVPRLHGRPELVALPLELDGVRSGSPQLLGFGALFLETFGEDTSITLQLLQLCCDRHAGLGFA